MDEYVNRILRNHVASEDIDPWGPVPKEVAEQWDREVAEFEEEDKKNPQPRFTSGRDFIEYIRRQP
ncbi:MAG: hypothetical protein U0350_49120 [Caldilineaceae bacterium]